VSISVLWSRIFDPLIPNVRSSLSTPLQEARNSPYGQPENYYRDITPSVDLWDTCSLVYIWLYDISVVPRRGMVMRRVLEYDARVSFVLLAGTCTVSPSFPVSPNLML